MQGSSSPHLLEARIAMLERQNKMLQAALMAALDISVTIDANLSRRGTMTPSSTIASSSNEANVLGCRRPSNASVATSMGSVNDTVVRKPYRSPSSTDPAGPGDRSDGIYGFSPVSMASIHEGQSGIGIDTHRIMTLESENAGLQALEILDDLELLWPGDTDEDRRLAT